MKCEISKTKIHLFYDGLLNEDDIEYLLQHVKKCKVCRKELNYLNFLEKQFSAMKNFTTSKELLSKLNNIEKKRDSFWELLKDTIKITFNTNNEAFQIEPILEKKLYEKYSEKTLRWIFYC